MLDVQHMVATTEAARNAIRQLGQWHTIISALAELFSQSQCSLGVICATFMELFHMKQMIKKLLKIAGLEMHRYVPGASSGAQIVAALNHFSIDLVLDVGANVGQFGKELRVGGYNGVIISYEPLLEAHAELLKASAGDINWHAFEPTALGSRNGKVEINVAQNSVSSSILPMLPSHVQAAPQSAYADRLTVPIKRLDDTLDEHFKESVAPLLKVDTQGYEWDVLDGAPVALAKCKGVLLELSLVHLYEGQRIWQEMIARLESLGFSLWAIQPGFTDPKNGRTLQVDGMFLKLRGRQLVD